MSFSWLFSNEGSLPHGHEIRVLHCATAEQGRARLAEAGKILGEDGARVLARKLGSYELDDSLVRSLTLAGVKLGERGEFPALSPARWTETPPAQYLKEGEVAAGLVLTPRQRESFLRFLARNRVNADGEIGAERAIRLARHFFFREPIVVVIRYTAPRFARG